MRIANLLNVAIAVGGGLVLTSCGILVTILSPTDGQLIRAQPFHLTIQTSTPNVSYAIWIDGAPATDQYFHGLCRGGPSADMWCSINEGTHRVDVTVTDASGNQGSDTVTFTYDAPLSTSVSYPSAGQKLSTNNVSVEFSSAQVTGALTGYTCQLDSGPASPCASPQAYSGLSEGAHSVTVKGTDALDTSSTKVSFLVNTTGFTSVPAKQVTVGRSHSCALLTTGKVRCWGEGADGKLGYGNTENIGDDEFPSSAGDVNVGGEVVQIVAGDIHTCALLTTGKVRCWGYGGSGALGYANTNSIGDDEFPSSAGDVDVGGQVVQLAAAGIHTCALLNTGSVRCWGRYVLSDLDSNVIGDDEPPSSAGDLDIGGHVIQIATATDHTCVLLDTRKMRCWGSGVYGQLGYGNTKYQTPASARDVPVGAEVTQIALGEYHTCAVLADGSLHCWGLNFSDSASNNVNIGAPVIAVFAGGWSTSALLATHDVRSWGSFVPYSSINYGSPTTNLDVGGPVAQVALASNYGCVLLTTGQVRCWGRGQFGALGYANASNTSPGIPALPPAQNGDVFLGL